MCLSAACEGRTYGINCREDCGHCKDNSSCNVENGFCTNGCEDGFISDVCNTHIRKYNAHG